MKWKKCMGRVIATCVMLTLMLWLTGCGSDPEPVVPTPVVTPSSSPSPSLSPGGGTPLSITYPTPRPLKASPLVRTRAGALASTLSMVVDGTYCTQAWREDIFPASIALPVGPLSGDLLLVWTNSGTTNYISAPDTPTYGLPSSYTIATSADSTDGRDGTWSEVVNVTGNTARTRSHRFPFAGARWVRMTVTSAVPGPLGDTFSIDEIDLRDASNGTDDTFFFLGDSITVSAFTRCGDKQPSFADLVRQSAPERYPAMIDGGVDGVNSGYGVSIIDDWLALNPDFHVWAIGYGTNDAWQKVKPELFDKNLQTIVDHIEAAGRVPVIARIPFAAKGPADADVQALNSVIDKITSRNGLLPGPDLYSWFSAHPGEIGPDGVHPTDAGTRSINRLWYEALRPLYSTSP